MIGPFPPTIVEPQILIFFLVLEAGDTFNDLIRKLRRRHVLESSQKLCPVFCASNSARFRGSDIVPYAEAMLLLQVDMVLGVLAHGPELRSSLNLSLLL